MLGEHLLSIDVPVARHPIYYIDEVVHYYIIFKNNNSLLSYIFQTIPVRNLSS